MYSIWKKVSYLHAWIQYTILDAFTVASHKSYAGVSDEEEIFETEG